MYPSLLYVGYFSHTLDLVGNHCKLRTKSERVSQLLTFSLIELNNKLRGRWLPRATQGDGVNGNYETYFSPVSYFKPFLLKNTDIGSTTTQASCFFGDLQRLKYLKIELAGVVDWVC